MWVIPDFQLKVQSLDPSPLYLCLTSRVDQLSWDGSLEETRTKSQICSRWWRILSRYLWQPLTTFSWSPQSRCFGKSSISPQPPRRRNQRSQKWRNFEAICLFPEKWLMEYQLASLGDESQRNTEFLPSFSNPFLWIMLLGGQGWGAVTRTWEF